MGFGYSALYDSLQNFFNKFIFTNPFPINHFYRGLGESFFSKPKEYDLVVKIDHEDSEKDEYIYYRK